MARTAVVLLNLGGPDSLAAVQPFLYNLFCDPAILPFPKLLRVPLAWFIARRRLKEALRIYAHLGGKSPLLPNTRIQAEALEKALGKNFRVFVAMRYWHPLTQETVEDVLRYQPDQIVLLPLYPQFSTTTTSSSLKCWLETAREKGLNVSTRMIGCYPTAQGFIESIVEKLLPFLQEVDNLTQTHLLFSAHGLPRRIIARGDPYQKQVEQTVQAVVKMLGENPCSYSIAYQSRVGPVQWLGPDVTAEIRRLGQERKNVILAPVSFVSEHSETLYELDDQCRILAEDSGVRGFFRVPTVGSAPGFVEQLADLVRQKASDKGFVCSRKDEKCICRGLTEINV